MGTVKKPVAVAFLDWMFSNNKLRTLWQLATVYHRMFMLSSSDRQACMSLRARALAYLPS